MTIEINGIEDLPRAAKEFVGAIGERRVFAFYGKMGAGKTTFIKAVCEELGVRETVNSPTFAIVNEYLGGDGAPIYHFDFYRIKRIEEVQDIGYDEYVYSGCLCLMEWPELVEPLLPNDVVAVRIEEISDGVRRVTL